MTSRDLYAACSGMFAVLATQNLGAYLAEPRLGLAVTIVAFAFLFVATLAAHVATIISERRPERLLRSQTARSRTQKPRRQLAPVATVKTKAEMAA